MADALLRREAPATGASPAAPAPDLMALVAQHGAAITRLQSEMAAGAGPQGGNIIDALAAEAAGFVHAFLAVAQRPDVPPGIGLRESLVEAIASVLRGSKPQG